MKIKIRIQFMINIWSEIKMLLAFRLLKRLNLRIIFANNLKFKILKVNMLIKELLKKEKNINSKVSKKALEKMKIFRFLINTLQIKKWD
jgi:hypothetical protein